MSLAGWRKSSRSGGQQDSQCVEARVAPWRKSSRSSGAQNSDCVEARPASTGFQVRDSKLGDGSPIFDLESADFTGLLRTAVHGLSPEPNRARANILARARSRSQRAWSSRTKFGCARRLGCGQCGSDNQEGDGGAGLCGFPDG